MAGPRTVTGTDSPPQYPIESVDNALKLLLLFADRPSLRLTDASAYLGVASSTAHRLLAMLQYRGFVRQDPESRAYIAGSALTTIAEAVNGRIDVRALARPVLVRLSRDLNETVHLGRLDGNQVAFLDSIESTRAVRVSSRVGRSLPAHCTSTGKAMLSRLSRDDLLSLYPDSELAAVTEQSLRTLPALEKELKLTRTRGYAFSNEESEEGVVSAAVPVPAAGGRWYGLNVSVPVNRMSPAKRSAIVAALREAGGELADALG